VLPCLKGCNYFFPGQTPTGEKLEEILNKYIPRIEDPNIANKPIAIIVITDGVPSSYTADKRNFIELTRRSCM